MDFVGYGRKATQAGKLTPADAIALARRLGFREPEFDGVRSMEDLPEVAHVVHWAIAAELLAVRATKVVPGPRAEDLQRDPLAACFKAAIVLDEHGLLDGFRREWRKHYVEFLDASVPSLLAAMVEAGGEAQINAIQSSAWEQVADTYGYELDTPPSAPASTRSSTGSSRSSPDLGAAQRDDQDVRLPELGGALATAAIAMGGDNLE